MYDADCDEWYFIESMTDGHDYAATATRDNKVIITGGSNYSKSVEQYDPETDTWTRLPDLLLGRQCHALVNLDDCLFAIGGFTSKNGVISGVETLAADGDSWFAGPAMSVARYAHAAAVISVSMYYFSTIVYQYAVATHCQ